MNIQESDILRTLFDEPFVNQRFLSESSGHSLGVVNRSLKALMNDGYLDEYNQLTAKAREEIKTKSPRNAIILAAGYGMRMVPINMSTPKALLKVKGETLIERQIKQLQDVGVQEVTIVVGFMKESFDYLIDEYHVDLVVNPDYANKNNLSSLALVADRISNTYIIPSDIWYYTNPFQKVELYSWYMVSDREDEESDVRVNRKMELTALHGNVEGNAMIGIAYLMEEDAVIIRNRLKKMNDSGEHNDDFWEMSLYDRGKMIVPARVVHAAEAVEINTYEQLRELDGESDHLKSDALDAIAEVLKCSYKDIVDITVLKKGMTNRSFLFSVESRKYIMRIPGEGTDQLINRKQEADVFKAISGFGLCDDPVYLNPENGYKITKFLEGVRVCDSHNEADVTRCMEKLRTFHNLKLKVEHTFDIFGQIDFYESLWNGTSSAYRDYQKTKENVFSLIPFIKSQPKDWCLTHIDAVPDNFLFYEMNGREELQLTDWEYSGMQDPHVDLAMFAIYSYYHKNQIDLLMEMYFGSLPDHQIKAKIYAYVAACGLLWSNWTEYKRTLGVEFGEYGLKQYRYAKEYYRYALEEISLI